jgi:hypothetical protein
MKRSTFTRVSLSLAALLTLNSTACLPAGDVEESEMDSTLLRRTGETSSWSYRGLMPRLESPKLVVSLKGHTVHVSGLLPVGFTGRLPFHAKTEVILGGRTMVHVVYPIATVSPNGVTESGLPTRNPEPGVYNICGGDNFHASNEIGSFGGFPFIEYVCGHEDFDGRIRSGIAFHGPITSITADSTEYWSLRRGPVSHACNRMLGEHILEMAHVIGFDRNPGISPVVKVIAGFDTMGGKNIDVEYASYGWTRPPAAESIVFPVWQAVRLRADGTTELHFPRWACETRRCPLMPANKYNGYTGRPL